MEQVKKVSKLDPEAAVPFVGEALKQVAAEVGNGAAVLGFVGAPFTLASYIVEGGSSKNFENIKRMVWTRGRRGHGVEAGAQGAWCECGGAGGVVGRGVDAGAQVAWPERACAADGVGRGAVVVVEGGLLKNCERVQARTPGRGVDMGARGGHGGAGARAKKKRQVRGRG
eukprot:364948-Chlamydomonas_euryale.AAC.14